MPRRWQAMRLQPGSEQGATSAGEIVNHMANDARRYEDFNPFINQLGSAPVYTALILFLLYRLLGVGALGGVAVMCVSMYWANKASAEAEEIVQMPLHCCAFPCGSMPP